MGAGLGRVSGVTHSFRNVNACYKALVNLGWVTYCRGFIDAAGQNHPTTLAPFGELLDRFASPDQWVLSRSSDLSELDQRQAQSLSLAYGKQGLLLLV